MAVGRQLRLGAFLFSLGRHAPAWRHPDVDPGDAFPRRVLHRTRAESGSRKVRLAAGTAKFVFTAPQNLDAAAAFARGFDDFIEFVLPELRSRGLFREDHEGSTLRQHLGPARPQPDRRSPSSVAA